MSTKKRTLFETLLARLDGFDSARIRRSLSVYGDPDAPLFKSQNLLIGVGFFILRSGCLTLEIFLHSKFGKRYLTVPKAIFGLFLPVFSVYLGMFDFQIIAKLNPVSPGFVKFFEPNAERLAEAVDNEARTIRKKLRDAKQAKIDSIRNELQKIEVKLDAKIDDLTGKVVTAVEQHDKIGLLNDKHIVALERAAHRNAALSMTAQLESELADMAEVDMKSAGPPLSRSIWDRTADFFRVLFIRNATYTDDRGHTVNRVILFSGFQWFFAIYGIMFNLRMLQIYSRRILHGFGAVKESNPNSSGEPLWIWNPFYLLGQLCNAKTDVVKQFVEPLFCYVMGLLLRPLLPSSLKFLSAWLIVGSILLFIRTYVENRTREELHLDRLANEMNAEAYNTQVQAPRTTEHVAKAEGL